MAGASAGDLLERDRELGEIDALLAEARGGRGSVAMLEAPAGRGKTALIREARALAQRAGMLVLSAIAAELERDFAFGVVRQLFEPVVRGQAADERLLSGAAALAAPLFELGSAEDGLADASYARLHGLFWLCANLAERHPVVLVVDDVHWADAPSLRFLDLVARRVEDMALVVVLAARPSEPGAEQEPLDGLVVAPATVLLRPAPLTVAAIGELCQRVLGGRADERFVAAAADSTGGNPLFVRELLRAAGDAGLSGQAHESSALKRIAPDTLTRMLLARLRRLPAHALAVARTVAVLGDRSTLARISCLAGLDRNEVVTGVDLLVQAGLLERERLKFVHPIVQEAVGAGLLSLEVRDHHREAARLLASERAPASEVAAHLLACDPEGNEWAAEVLAKAGRRALSDGAADIAQRLLSRALVEPPPPAQRPQVLLDLGRAEARVGSPDASEHLEAAIEDGDTVTAAQAAQLKAFVMIGRDDAPAAARVLSEALRRTDELPSELRAELEDHYLQGLNYVDEAYAEYLERIQAGVSRGRPAALAHKAWIDAVTGASCSDVVGVARRALADGSIVRSVGEGNYTAFYAIEALHVAEAADDAAVALRDAFAAARRAGSPFMLATLSFMRPRWERAFGDLRKAEDELRDGLAVFEEGQARAGSYVVAVNLAGVLLDRGDIEGAEAVLSPLPSQERGVGVIGLHAVRARLHAERQHWPAVLDELEQQYRMERARGWVLTNREFTRLLEIRALVAMGRSAEALRVADAEVQLHRERRAAGAQALAHLSRALVVGGAHRLDELEAASECAARSPLLLVQAMVLAELGRVLRAAGRRSEARGPLRRALDVARRCGARRLEGRVHDELMAAGARPRRVGLVGADTLTPAERRVADLAASGMTNREIAETLFVTLKTVEVHLGRSYDKLGIRGRSQLAAALGAEGTEKRFSNAASG